VCVRDADCIVALFELVARHDIFVTQKSAN
jgi:hypothetical protein